MIDDICVFSEDYQVFLKRKQRLFKSESQIKKMPEIFDSIVNLM